MQFEASEIERFECWTELGFLNATSLPVTKKSPFFSSDESEEEEDHRKKFKIKIKPLLADREVTAPTVDELKASIGNISLSPSPVVSHPDITVLALPAFIIGHLCLLFPCFMRVGLLAPVFQIWGVFIIRTQMLLYVLSTCCISYFGCMLIFLLSAHVPAETIGYCRHHPQVAGCNSFDAAQLMSPNSSTHSSPWFN